MKKINLLHCIYISGPITGIDNYKQHFADAKNELAKYFVVTTDQETVYPTIFNPADLENVESWNDGMKKTIIHLFESDTVCFLDNWYNSKGCCIEYLIARALGLNIVRFTEGKSLKDGDREEPYTEYGLLESDECYEVMKNESCICLQNYGWQIIPVIGYGEDLEHEKSDEMPAPEKELVNHPEHYNGGSDYECYKVLKNWLTPEQYKGWLLGSSLKYLCRLGKKDDTIQDLEKSKWYEDHLLEELQIEK